MIQELSKYQFDTLNRAANGDTRVFIVLFPSTQDSDEKQAEFRKDMRDVGELIGMGLIEDVSETFKESIAASKLNANREYGVYVITELGIRMFQGFEGRRVN
jgi:hypothetical protein